MAKRWSEQRGGAPIGGRQGGAPDVQGNTDAREGPQLRKAAAR
jgi:hypothetical protein